MFTREHFEQVARVISAQRTSKPDAELYGLAARAAIEQRLDALANDFADIFAESNERFSRKAFIGACNAVSRSEIRRLVNQSNASRA